MVRVGQRYLIGAVAFAVAAVWTGVSLVGGFECLLVFGLASLVVAAIQRRHDLDARRSRRPTRARVRRARPGQSRVRRLRHDRGSLPPPAPPWPYDDRETTDWRRSARSGW